MSVPIIIRLAPLLRLADLDELRRRGRTVYDASAFKPFHVEKPLPVVVDHDEENVVGHVREICYREAPEGGRWAYVHARLHEQPPWLRRGAGASFGAVLRRSLDLDGLERVLDQRLVEVTICRSNKPLEPLSRVEWIGDPSPDLPAVAATTSARAAGEIRSPGVRVLRRNVGRVLGVR